jgi:hypothetical protein
LLVTSRSQVALPQQRAAWTVRGVIDTLLMLVVLPIAVHKGNGGSQHASQALQHANVASKCLHPTRIMLPEP